MLGTEGEPSLLVTVLHEYEPSYFKFYVVNGSWEGVFTDGHVTVHMPHGGDYSDLGTTEILCSNQDRLRGDYNTVFYNFDNPDYVAPKAEEVFFADMDDDIPF
jgi:hypothetical protein